MKITNIETFLVSPRWLFLKVSTDEGITGWGEMLKDDAKACAAGALEVGDYLIGQDPRRVVHHWQAIHRGAFYRGGPIKTAISSGIDQALWDIKGKALGVPVHELLGGTARDMLTLALKQALDKHGFDAAFGGARRDDRGPREERGPRPENTGGPQVGDTALPGAIPDEVPGDAEDVAQ